MMKRLFFIPVFFISLVLGLTGCLSSGEGDNYEEFNDVLCVVGHNDNRNQPTLNFYKGEILASVLEPQYQTKGTAISASFKIDYDQQTSNQYVQATNLLKSSVPIPQFSYQTNSNFSPTEVSDNIYPIGNLQYTYYSNQLGRIFFVTRIDSLYAAQNVSYKLVYVPKEGDEEKGSVKDVFLYAEMTGDQSGERTSFNELNTYNLNELFRLGSDSIIRTTGVECKYLSLNLRYYSGTRSNEPQWTYATGSANSSVNLLMFKKDLE